MSAGFPGRHRRKGHPLRALALISVLAVCAACSPLRGFPDNPDDNDQNIKDLQTLAVDAKAKYYASTDPATLKSLRNRVILSEMQIYELNFTEFQEKLWGDNNLFNASSDLTVLALTGLAATTGNATTKSALAAASAGIIGAKGAIDRDIYFQQTLPAVLAQMSANRDKIKATILNNLNKDDASYPLLQGEADLQVLVRASSIPDAIQSITQTATSNKIAAAQEVELSRTSSFSQSTSAQQIAAWIGFGHDSKGKAYMHNPTNLGKLQAWVDANLPGMPVRQLLNDAAKSQVLETSRQKAISDLNIPPLTP